MAILFRRPFLRPPGDLFVSLAGTPTRLAAPGQRHREDDGGRRGHDGHGLGRSTARRRHDGQPAEHAKADREGSPSELGQGNQQNSDDGSEDSPPALGGDQARRAQTHHQLRRAGTLLEPKSRQERHSQKRARGVRIGQGGGQAPEVLCRHGERVPPGRRGHEAGRCGDGTHRHEQLCRQDPIPAPEAPRGQERGPEADDAGTQGQERPWPPLGGGTNEPPQRQGTHGSRRDNRPLVGTGEEQAGRHDQRHRQHERGVRRVERPLAESRGHHQPATIPAKTAGVATPRS